MSCPSCGGGDRRCYCKTRARRDAEIARRAEIRRSLPGASLYNAIAPVTLQRLVKIAEAQSTSVDRVMNKALDYYVSRFERPPVPSVDSIRNRTES